MKNASEPTKANNKSSKVNGIVSYLILLIILLLITWGIFRYFSYKSAAINVPTNAVNTTAANTAPVVVGVANVLQQDVNDTVQALGTVTSTNSVVLMPLSSGILTKIYFKEGSFVQKGQLLALIDDRTAKAALLQSEGQLLRDQALLSNAELDLQRYATLWKQDSIAKQQYDTQASLVQQYQGVVKTDQAAVDNAKVQLSYTRVVAPVDGRIGLRLVDVGNSVSSSTGIANITQLKNISVVFAVPEQYLAQLMPFIDHPEHRVVIEAWDRQNTQKLAEGKLVALDSQVSTATGSINIKASFDNHRQHLFPNQFVNIRMNLGSIKNAIIVPTVALQLGSKGSFVYKVNANQTVSVVYVKTGVVQGDTTVVTEGALRENDRVVIDGVDKLKDGAKIKLGQSHTAQQNHSTQALAAQGTSGQPSHLATP
ncbi:efflux RND transporter periplasmic adaptor subunit [Acinetobacter pullicarnis]|uniref:efflux RND transporter periplasmic adaptor subunit n=1 Tax=Acinetobacter pullicarnis TaxID=2576829 RepID=UPI0011213B13|nr:efflux RND transporter periplasmic adaptor subunit [Acinetobacter pullicarnis]